MHQSDNKYTKLRWILTIAGLVLYVVDICTDTLLAVKYLNEGLYLWTSLTLLFILAGLLVTQTFSYAWYWDDLNNFVINPEGIMTNVGLFVLHLLGVGIFTRYYQMLKKAYKVVWKPTVEERRDVHQKLFCMAADLSMLKLFESFLESVPQLLLQLYIALDHNHFSILQYLSMAFSFLNVAWSLVDYRRCLRRSLPNIREMPSGIPTVIYLLYKLCTITSNILSYSLLLMLSVYSTIGLAVHWLLGTIWTHSLRTHFCSSKGLEFLYRAVIGVILTFTFFNVKGKNTKVEMIVYYIFHFIINVTAPVLLMFLKPESRSDTFLLTVCGLIIGGLVLGLVMLMLYYIFLHPKGKWREADEVDGLGSALASNHSPQRPPFPAARRRGAGGLTD